ncbi:MAG: hypothetical protein VW226_09385 [Rhodospirillaceae bacterium]|jgi:hypothetical protein
MSAKTNPLKLNNLQLKALTIFQQLARFPETSSRNDKEEVLLTNLPNPHGNHFHCGDAVVLAKDATGLKNPAVWKALERKGLARSMYPFGLTLTRDGEEYPTGLSEKILHRSDH